MISVLDEERSRNAALRQRLKEVERKLGALEARDRARDGLLQLLRRRAFRAMETVRILKERLPGAVAQAEGEIDRDMLDLPPLPCPCCGDDMTAKNAP